jgi:hypothetical protein
MSIELKIKSKHLSEEAKIIRFEEHKQLKQYQWALKKYIETGSNDMFPRWNNTAFMTYVSLNHHRKWDVRNENRATFLARAYIAGVPYNTAEQKRNADNEHVFFNDILPRVASMVAKYGKCEAGDYDYAKNGYTRLPTKQLKDKLAAWCGLNQ